jgi:hypothetical protein
MDYLEFQMLSVFLFTQRCNIYGQDKLMEIAINQRNEDKCLNYTGISAISILLRIWDIGYHDGINLLHFICETFS